MIALLFALIATICAYTSARAAACVIADEPRREAMAVRGIVETTYARGATLDRLVAIEEEDAA